MAEVQAQRIDEFGVNSMGEQGPIFSLVEEPAGEDPVLEGFDRELDRVLAEVQSIYDAALAKIDELLEDRVTRFERHHASTEVDEEKVAAIVAQRRKSRQRDADSKEAWRKVYAAVQIG